MTTITVGYGVYVFVFYNFWVNDNDWSGGKTESLNVHVFHSLNDPLIFDPAIHVQ